MNGRLLDLFSSMSVSLSVNLLICLSVKIKQSLSRHEICPAPSVLSRDLPEKKIVCN